MPAPRGYNIWLDNARQSEFVHRFFQSVEGLYDLVGGRRQAETFCDFAYLLPVAGKLTRSGGGHNGDSGVIVKRLQSLICYALDLWNDISRLDVLD